MIKMKKIQIKVILNKKRNPGQLSPEQVKSLLEAMNNQEKKVQDKINAKKVKGKPVKTKKDW
jgi:signal recognition particle receptor subunit beta